MPFRGLLSVEEEPSTGPRGISSFKSTPTSTVIKKSAMKTFSSSLLSERSMPLFGKLESKGVWLV